MVKIGDKLKILLNLEDHVGYEGQELTIKTIEPNSYITVEEGEWHIGMEETDLFTDKKYKQ